MFVLDANIFIEAHRRYYSFDIAPGFWQHLQQQAANGRLLSIDWVYREIAKNDEDDELRGWANNEFLEFFQSTDSETVFAAYREVISWAMTQSQFSDAAKSEFASVADSWLVAYAKAFGCIVVTHETYSPNIKRKIPIPNACVALGITYINTFDMLRQLNIKLG